MVEAGRTALVLGGGGVAGIAWEVGILAGLQRAGRPIHLAATLIGTSAGASVAALLSAGTDLEAMVAEQSTDGNETWRPYSRAESARLTRELMAKVGEDVRAARQRIGAHALRAAVPEEQVRLAGIRRRIDDAQWSARDLRIVAMDAVSAERVVFVATDGVPLDLAVAASCAVPGTWPPVRIGEQTFIDGGVYSHVNADLAAGAEEVHIVAPFGWGEDNPVSGHLRAEVGLLKARGSRVNVIIPDEASIAAMSDNVLDPARRAGSVVAGLRQAAELASASSS